MKHIFIILLLLPAILLPAISPAQVRVTAAAGAAMNKSGTYFSTLLNVGYEYRNVSVMADMRAAVHQNAGYFGLHGGYNFVINEDMAIKPYAGAWYRKTGRTSAQDRYVHSGVTEILSTTDRKDRNGFNAGFGAQFIYRYLFMDLSNVGQWQASLGLSYKF